VKLPGPPKQYDQHDQAQMRTLLEQNDASAVKKTQIMEKTIWRSPNGTLYQVTMSNAGAWVIAAV
jgi:hypothetical protein